VDLDSDRAALDAEQGRRPDGCEHGGCSSQRWS
jgi:hypothetical protein